MLLATRPWCDRATALVAQLTVLSPSRSSTNRTVTAPVEQFRDDDPQLDSTRCRFTDSCGRRPVGLGGREEAACSPGSSTAAAWPARRWPAHRRAVRAGLPRPVEHLEHHRRSRAGAQAGGDEQPMGAVFAGVSVEYELLVDYVRADDPGRHPLASALGSAEPNLVWLETHGTSTERAAAVSVHRIYKALRGDGSGQHQCPPQDHPGSPARGRRSLRHGVEPPASGDIRSTIAGDHQLGMPAPMRCHRSTTPAQDQFWFRTAVGYFAPRCSSDAPTRRLPGIGRADASVAHVSDASARPTVIACAE